MSSSTTVNLDEEGRIQIDSLTVGGGTGGTQTLDIDSSPVGGGGNDELVLDSLTNQSGTLADGAIDLGSTVPTTNPPYYTELDAPTGGPAFSNAGHFVSESDGTTASPTSDQFLGLDFTNTGTLEVAGNLNFGPELVGTPGPQTLTNDGAVTVDSTGFFEVEGSGSDTTTLDDDGGTITNNGSFEVTSGIVTQKATAVTGTAIHMLGSSLTFTGSGAGVWDFQEVSTANTVTGNMVAGQTIRVDGGTVAPFSDEDAADLTVLGSNTWGGTVILDSNGVSTNYADLEGTGTQTITAGGVLETEGAATGDTTDRYLRGDIDVDGGRVDLAAANTVMDSDNGATTLTITAGNMTVEGTAELNLSAGDSSIDAEGGTLTDDGSLVLTGDGATFTENATDTSSSTQPILLVGEASLVFTGPGKGLWDLQRGASLTGNMAAGQTVRVLGGTDTFPDGNAPEGNQSDADIHLNGSNTWGGTVILDSFDGQGLASIEATGNEGPSAFTETIASGGQLLSEQGGGDTRQIDFNIINNGTIDLSADHTDNNENNVITNNATMTVEGQLIGDEINQTGDDEDPVIHNNGTLDLGANAQLNVFNLTESATAHLGLTVDGNPASGDFSTIPVGTTTSLNGAGTISLAGTLDLTLPGGYSSPTIGDTFPVVAASDPINYQPTVTGTFSTVTGAQITASTAFQVDYAAHTVSLEAVANTAPGGTVVLAASNVSAPTAPNTSPSPGQPVSATFRVTNNGTGTAIGPWNDSVYVGTSSTYSPGDALLERIPQTGNIGSGDSYDVNVQAFLPPLPAGGNYQLIVVPDSGGRVSVPSADTQAVSPAFVVSPPPDLGNGPVSTTVAAGQDLYVQVTVGDNADSKVSLNEQGVDLLASQGVFPTENSSTEQASGSSGPASLILPESSPGVWYVDLHGEDGAGLPPGESVTATAAMIPLSVTHVEPTRGTTQASSSIIILQGSDFGSDTTVTLSNSGAQLAAYSVDVHSSTLLYASFRLDLIDAGVYDIVVTSHGQTTTLSRAFTVTNGAVDQVTVTATGPPSIRFGWAGDLDVTVTNVGDSDVTVPIVSVSASSNGEVEAPGSSTLGPSADIIAPNFSSKDTGPLPPSVLPPGDSATFDFFVAAILDEGDTDMSYAASAVTSADPNPIDWSAQLASDQPSYLSAGAWSTVVNDVASEMGPTEGSYATALPAVFNEAAGYGVSFTSETQVLQYLVDRALATGPGAPVSGTLDSTGPNPLAQTNLSLDDGNGDQYGTTSWYNGQFNFWDVVPSTYELTVPGYTPNPAQQVVADPTATGLTVSVQTGATLSGVITNNGQPVSGAVVTATDSEATLSSNETGADGSYQITGLESGSVSVTASAEGLIPSDASTVTVAAPATTTDNITLQSGATASGTITIPGGGSPPVGTAVIAEATGGGQPAVGVVDSNGDGGYTIGGLAPGDYNVTATAPGFGEATGSMTVVGTTPITGQDLALTGPGTVNGVVTDADTGQPIAGATVSSDQLGGGPTITTGADGSYTVTDLAPGPVLISIVPPDDTHVAQQVSSTVSATGATALDVALEPSGSLTATIDDGSGNPLAGIDVILVGPTPFESPGVSTTDSGIQSAFLTDDSGTITTDGLLPGPYDLQVQGSTVDHPFTIGPGSRDVSFTVTVPVATVSGVIHDRAGNPASGVPVSILAGGQPVAGTTTAADGSYQFSLTHTGPLEVVASSPAIGVLSSAVSATIGSATTVPILTAGTGSVQVTVTNGSGPVMAATVNLTQSDGDSAVSATTDASGAATLANLTPGSYELAVGDGTDAPASQTVTVSSSSQDITVPLGTGGAIAGTVTDSSSAPIAGADVAAVTGADTIAGSTTTAADGTYQLAGLAPGTYSLSISDDEHVPTVVSGVMVAAGGTADGNASLASTGSTLTLSLSPAGGSTVLPAVLVGVEDSTGTLIRTAVLGPARSASDVAATQAVADLAPGPYTLLVEQAGAAPVTQAVTLTGGGSTVAVSAPATASLLSLPANEVPAASSADQALTRTDAGADTAHAKATPHEEEPGGEESLSFTGLLASYIEGKSTQTTLPGDDATLAMKVKNITVTTTLDSACYSTTTFASLAIQQGLLSKAYARLGPDRAAYREAVEGLDQAQGGQLGLDAVAGAKFVPTVAALVLAGEEAAGAAAGAHIVVSGTELAGSTLAGLTTEVAETVQEAEAPSSQNLSAGAAAGSALKFSAESVKSGLSAAGAHVAGAGLETTMLAVSAMKQTTEVTELAEQNFKTVAPLEDSINTSLERYIDDLKNVQDLAESFTETSYTTKLYCPPPPIITKKYPIVIIPILIHSPGDPNGITGPAGYSSPAPQWVAGRSALPYTVNFTNEPTASAPATQVVVTEPVPSDIDPNSVQLTGFGFGASTSVNIPAGQQSFSQQFTNLNLPNGDYLDVSGVYDPQAAGGANGVITWTFSTIDPSTGDLDSAPNAGFLPPDDAAGDGEGFVSWTGTAKSGLTTGTTVTGQASIVFDRNAAISTPVWTNTVDATPPTASVTPLPATSAAGNLDVSWSGQDGTGSGIANYDVYESTDGGPLTQILQGTTLTSTQVPIVAGHTYGFAVDATDNVGNQSTAPTTAQTTTSAVPATKPPPPTQPVTPQAAPPGYSLVASDGGIFNFGGSPFLGSTGGTALNKPIVGMASTPDGEGYWLVASDGGVFSFGDAKFHGSAGGTALNAPIVGMAATPSGHGYWLVASDGGIFNYGDAGFFGSAGNIHLNKPIVGMAATHDGGGYWLVASDGGIFSFGDAKFHGSTGGTALNKPIVGMAPVPDGGGYWLVASDGGIFSFGDAKFHGSTGGTALNKPIVGMAPVPDGGGYWLVASDGGIFSFGDAKFHGSTGGTALNEPVVGMSAP